MALRLTCALLLSCCPSAVASAVDVAHRTTTCDSDECAADEHSLLQQAQRTASPAAQESAQLSPTTASSDSCMCSKLFPTCHSDGWCYNGWVWHWTHCAGHCNADYHEHGVPACTYRTWQAKDAATKMVLGTRDNMDPKLQDLGIDLTGLWWMRGNPVPEVLASFAGTSVNSTSYPLMMSVPNSLKNHWSWMDNTAGELLVAFYSTSSPEDPMQIIMEDAENGGIHTALTDFPGIYVDKWGFHKINDDEWDRPTTFQAHSLIGKTFGDSNYTLTRVLREDGSETQYWADFMASSDSVQQLSFGNDDPCMRQCQVLSTCYLCQKQCS